MDVADLQVALKSLGVADGAAAFVCGAALSGRVCDDSRAVQAGDVFVAVRGVQADGHDFVNESVRRGAAVVVAQRPVGVGDEVVLLVVPDSAAALAQLAHAAAGRPSAVLRVVGVTGTNGKTTVTYLTRAILNAAGLPCGLIGTVSYDVGQGSEPAPNTTPGALEMAELLRRARANGLAAAALECSSHGLDQKRTDGIQFTAAAFTNLTGDHLDYHGTLEAYQRAKARLFVGLAPSAAAVLNGHDPAGDALARQTRARVWRYGVGEGYDLSAQIARQEMRGTEFELNVLGRRCVVRSRLIGEHNVLNCLAAAGLAHAAGAPFEAIGAGLEQMTGVPGRLERLESDGGVTVLVDYAHTDDALRRALETVRPLADGEVVVVFGCGGERDRTKRPRMAAVAERLADRIILTDDNPRREDPAAIRGEIRAGLSAGGLSRLREIADRREAIAWAIASSRPGDVVLIAGKGHEDYQIIGTRRWPFDDRTVARECLSGAACAR